VDVRGARAAGGDACDSGDSGEAQIARELRDAQEQLTTTAEILEVIRGSLDDTQPVFDAIVRSGARLFPGAAVSIALVENGMVNMQITTIGLYIAKHVCNALLQLLTRAILP
jgi:hypothetical protein